MTTAIRGMLDIARDFEFQTDITRWGLTTGESEAAAGLSGLTAHISLTRSGASVDASLTKSLNERTATPGRYWCTFDRADLQTHLAAQVGRSVYVIVTKVGDVDPKPWKFHVVALIEGDDV